MAKINSKTVTPPVYTHEGAKASRSTNLQQLRRSVMACLLWEDGFYESGASIADRISLAVPHCTPEEVSNLAIDARQKMNLRHVPLLLVREMLRHPKHKEYVASTLPAIIQRPDELTEFLAIYWKDQPNAPLAAQVKKGLAAAFQKFDAYSLAKYNSDKDIKLRDVMFLVHPTPLNKEQAATWKKLADNALEPPDTWEVELSAGKNKKETFERLMAEKKLGAMALLRNLRGMTEAGVSQNSVREGIKAMRTERVLPFRFISAARHAPQFEPELEEAMIKSLADAEKLKGRTLLLVDVSGSMTSAISAKTEINRIDAACGLAILLREICEGIDIYTFAYNAKQVPSRHGFALRDAIMKQFGGGTNLGASLTTLSYGAGYDRVIVITDEQSHDKVNAPSTKGYILNVAAYQNGVGYGQWTTIDGWSDACVRYITELEAE